MEVKVPYDYSKLRGRIKEVYGTQDVFAEKMGWSYTTTVAKLKGYVDWRSEEMEKALDVLGVPISELHAYFFTVKVENNSTDKDGDDTE